MAAATPTVVFITGVGRGIGAGLLRSYLLRPNHLVIGSVRDASSPSYSNLENLPTGANSRLHLVSLESTVESDAASAVASSQQALGIDHIDIVIANAGVNPPVVAPELTKAEDMLSTYKVNAVGPMWLYQATRELLAKAQKPIWITISSSAGSVTKLEEFGITKLLAYGASKSAVNWLTVAIHATNPSWIATAIQPGFVDTDMGRVGSSALGLPAPPVSVEESVEKIIGFIDDATREKSSGILYDVISAERVPF